MCAFLNWDRSSPNVPTVEVEVVVTMIRRLPKLCVATATLVVVVLLLGTILDWPVAEAHVALTFPPARKYDLDFLDNSRTKAPCGMPKGKCMVFDKKKVKPIRIKFIILENRKKLTNLKKTKANLIKLYRNLNFKSSSHHPKQIPPQI